MITDPWLKSSIMAKRGLAKGEAGKRHELTIGKQGHFHYVYGPYAKPVLTINPGDVVVVETEDAFGPTSTVWPVSSRERRGRLWVSRWRRELWCKSQAVSM